MALHLIQGTMNEDNLRFTHEKKACRGTVARGPMKKDRRDWDYIWQETLRVIGEGETHRRKHVRKRNLAVEHKDALQRRDLSSGDRPFIQKEMFPLCLNHNLHKGIINLYPLFLFTINIVK